MVAPQLKRLYLVAGATVPDLSSLSTSFTSHLVITLDTALPPADPLASPDPFEAATGVSCSRARRAARTASTAWRDAASA